MIDFLLQVLREIWFILEDASIFLLFGFVLAGALATLVPARAMTRLFGTGRVKSVLWASAIGAPLPLCSCGVLPTALGLRRQGATDGATVAFLVATPETGLDSVAVSYALTDPLMTISRPAAGVVTAIAAGLTTNFLGPWAGQGSAAEDRSLREGDTAASENRECHHHNHTHDSTPFHGHVNDTAYGGSRAAEGDKAVQRWTMTAAHQIAMRIGRYAFRELLDDTSHWLVLGIVLSGFVAAALPSELIERYLGSGITSMLAMLLIGIPIYTCASSSTPLAAALVMKGLSPGAALVFLLAGPATNLGSIVVLLRFLGVRIVAIYLSTIAVVTLLAGYALNWAYQAWGLNPRATFGVGAAFLPESVKVAGAIVFIALLILSLRRARVPAEWTWLRDRLSGLTGIPLSTSRLHAFAFATAALLYLSTGLFEVRPGEVGIRSRFGRILTADLAPGLHFRLPWPFEAHHVVEQNRVRRVEFGVRNDSPRGIAPRSVTWQQHLMFGTPEPVKSGGVVFRQETAPAESFFLTGDGNLIDLRFAVHFSVKDARAFVYNVSEPEALVRSITLAALRAAAATSGIDAVYTTARSGLEQQVARAVQEILDRSGAGINVLSVHLLYVHPPEEVHDAFRDVASAQEDKLRTINRANTFAVEGVNQSQGEAAAMIEQALGFKEQRIRRAEGDAAAFAIRLDAYKRDPELTKFRLRLETAEAVLPGAQKIVTPGAADVKELDMWLFQPFTTGGRR